uniref:7TM_GPCR_Srx domain-containing protein n=1 Tax=Meloidogyne floridensis TaxID=298350 RepID=A0A915NH29_9BILA
MHVIPDSTMFRSYIIIYGICLFFGGIISYFQFNIITGLNLNFDNLLYYIKAIVKNSFRILRSVLIISLILIFGWLISSIGRNNIMVLMNIIIFSITNLFIPKSNQQFSIIIANVVSLTSSIITCIYIITAGINAIILISCNSEYRNAYKSVFGKLIPKNKVSPNQPLFIKSDKGKIKNNNNLNNQQP